MIGDGLAVPSFLQLGGEQAGLVAFRDRPAAVAPGDHPRRREYLSGRDRGRIAPPSGGGGSPGLRSARSALGEIVAAAVRVAPGAEPPAADELKGHVRALLAPQKAPSTWFLVEALPLTGPGKVQKFA